MQGIHPIIKAKGISSHWVINRLRKITGIKTIGHAGTLDPLAAGVLVVGIGRWAVKKLWEQQKKEKEYLAAIKLGQGSATDDAAGRKTNWLVKNIPPEKELVKVIRSFVGKIRQRPPDFSAKKIKGQRAYKMALKEKPLKLKQQTVKIRSIKLIKYKWPFLRLKIVCGPGTYIRSLARDIGQKLKTGAYLADLERTRVGEFIKKDAWTLEKFAKEYQKRKIIMTLCLIQSENKILLGMKKRGFGQKRWNGFGGKIHGRENIERATKRELREEAGVRAINLKKRGLFIFEFQDSPNIIEVHLFECRKYQGQPEETEEMKPRWFSVDKIPYQNMWPDDKYWLPLFLKGKNSRGEFYFKNINTLLYHSLREVKII